MRERLLNKPIQGPDCDCCGYYGTTTGQRRKREERRWKQHEKKAWGNS